MKGSSILFKLSTSSKTGWKYSWRLLNNGGVGGGGNGGVLAIDSLVFSPIAVFVVVIIFHLLLLPLQQNKKGY
jgi:hypothetical protein